MDNEKDPLKTDRYTGNQNARKYEKRARLSLTCEMADKNRWVKQAQREGKTLAQWVSTCCNQHSTPQATDKKE